MRKIFISVFFLFLATVLFFACKKEFSKDPPGDEITTKVKSWLDLQKPATQPNKTANVELLKNNLDFSKLRYEELNRDKQFLIVPVNDKFKTLKNIDKKTIPELVLTLDRRGNIERGNLVLYIPGPGSPSSELPANTFNKMYNSKNIDCNGTFRFLSITGKRLYEYGYENGKIHSYGKVQQKPEQQSTKGAGTNMCYDWYLHTRVWENGVLVHEDWEYLGTTCDADYGACDDPILQGICPDDGSGGGGGEGMNDCCIPDPNIQFLSGSISETDLDQCGVESINPNTGNPTKECTHKWSFNRNNLLGFVWTYSSVESTSLEKIGNVWKFKTLTHNPNISVSGMTPPCVNAFCTVQSALPLISADGSRAQMDLDYTSGWQLQCIGLQYATISAGGHARSFWAPPQ